MSIRVSTEKKVIRNVFYGLRVFFVEHCLCIHRQMVGALIEAGQASYLLYKFLVSL